MQGNNFKIESLKIRELCRKAKLNNLVEMGDKGEEEDKGEEREGLMAKDS